VILGAGYDDRALRFRSPGVRFFELDHPDTQADKRLTASLAIRPEGTDLEAVLAQANARRPNATAEPWRTILTVSGHRDLLARAGWTIAGTTDHADLDPEARPGRSMLVVARPGS